MAEITDKAKASTNKGQVAGHDHELGLFNLNLAWLKLLNAIKPGLFYHKSRHFLVRKFGCLERKKVKSLSKTAE